MQDLPVAIQFCEVSHFHQIRRTITPTTVVFLAFESPHCCQTKNPPKAKKYSWILEFTVGKNDGGNQPLFSQNNTVKFVQTSHLFSSSRSQKTATYCLLWCCLLRGQRNTSWRRLFFNFVRASIKRDWYRRLFRELYWAGWAIQTAAETYRGHQCTVFIPELKHLLCAPASWSFLLWRKANTGWFARVRGRP